MNKKRKHIIKDEFLYFRVDDLLLVDSLVEANKAEGQTRLQCNPENVDQKYITAGLCFVNVQVRTPKDYRMYSHQGIVSSLNFYPALKAGDYNTLTADLVIKKNHDAGLVFFPINPFPKIELLEIHYAPMKPMIDDDLERWMLSGIDISFQNPPQGGGR